MNPSTETSPFCNGTMDGTRFILSRSQRESVACLLSAARVALTGTLLILAGIVTAWGVVGKAYMHWLGFRSQEASFQRPESWDRTPKRMCRVGRPGHSSRR